MSDSFTILIYPHQRIRHLQPAVDGLADAVMRLYGLDMSALCWAERREGTLARFEGGVCPEMAARIPSGKLDCAALLRYLREGGGWGYQLCFKGSVEDSFESRPGSAPDAGEAERHAARLVRRFKADRERLLPLLTGEFSGGEGGVPLEGFLNELVPWAREALGLRLVMTWQSAIFATTAVAFPLMYRTARGAFESFDRDLADAGRTLGRSNTWVFWRVQLPCCKQGILAGTVLAFARALGEYGATSMVAGYTPGRTATISTTVYQLWRTGDDVGALRWVLVNLAISAAFLFAISLLERRRETCRFR